MLVLTRELRESIIISDLITVTVLEINIYKKKVKIGITAPREVSVDREEIYWVKKREKTILLDEGFLMNHACRRT